MQQTQKYKLNLIESSDPFLPEGLNQNTQKIEDVLSAAIETHEEEVKAVTDGLEARVTVLEARKFACGTYKNPGGGNYTVHLGFTPVAVIAYNCFNSNQSACIVTGQVHTEYLSIVEGGFMAWGNVSGASEASYIAFA